MRAVDGVSSTASYTGPSEYESKVLNKKKRRANFEKELLKEQEEESKLKADVKAQMESDYDQEEAIDTTSVVPLLADRDFKTTQSNNPIVRFIRPDVFLNFRYVKRILPATYNVEPKIVDNKHAYDAPAISAKCPGVWFPADPMGLLISVPKMPLSMKRERLYSSGNHQIRLHIIFFRYFKRTSIDFITYIRGRLIVIVY